MKFAVVEYHSKSGAIWRANPDKPNYLEDPQRVIDPTSFGCYVSALHGEHIPLTLMAGQGQLLPRAIKRLTGWWPAHYALDYFAQFDVLLVVHQISDAHELARFVRRLRKTFPHIFIIGVPTQPYGLLRSHIERSPLARRHFLNYLQHCHIFLTVVKSTLPWYASLTSTPVVYMPQIYPVHFAAHYARPRAAKDPSIFVAGITGRPAITRGFRAAKALQAAFPHLQIRVTRIPDVSLDTSLLAGCSFDIIPFQSWREHLPWLAKQKIVINTDYTFTRGRVQVDCAAVGTPSLGANSDGQTDLFPQLAATLNTSDDELIALGRRLITDESYYQRQVDFARTRLQKYDYEQSAARLLRLVNSHRK
ncbi:MAG: glycosyltransferase [Candidatus Andersenbacteria bacterium]|nr:glycosyltransferase [Candidatus Andersenbacteria bacterium]